MTLSTLHPKAPILTNLVTAGVILFTPSVFANDDCDAEIHPGECIASENLPVDIVTETRTEIAIPEASEPEEIPEIEIAEPKESDELSIVITEAQIEGSPAQEPVAEEAGEPGTETIPITKEVEITLDNIFDAENVTPEIIFKYIDPEIKSALDISLEDIEVSFSGRLIEIQISLGKNFPKLETIIISTQSDSASEEVYFYNSDGNKEYLTDFSLKSITSQPELEETINKIAEYNERDFTIKSLPNTIEPNKQEIFDQLGVLNQDYIIDMNDISFFDYPRIGRIYFRVNNHENEYLGLIFIDLGDSNIQFYPKDNTISDEEILLTGEEYEKILTNLSPIIQKIDIQNTQIITEKLNGLYAELQNIIESQKSSIPLWKKFAEDIDVALEILSTQYGDQIVELDEFKKLQELRDVLQVNPSEEEAVAIPVIEENSPVITDDAPNINTDFQRDITGKALHYMLTHPYKTIALSLIGLFGSTRLKKWAAPQKK